MKNSENKNREFTKITYTAKKIVNRKLKNILLSLFLYFGFCIFSNVLFLQPYDLLYYYIKINNTGN